LANTGPDYIPVISSRPASPLGKELLPAAASLVPGQVKRGMEMLHLNDLRSRRLVVLFFAFLSGISAVSTAVVPAILHV
jgi:hypothetical protein